VGATGAGKSVQLEVEIEIQEGSDSVSRHIQDSEGPPGILLTVYPGPAHAMGSECEVLGSIIVLGIVLGTMKHYLGNAGILTACIMRAVLVM
jgi:hypothetical protein